MADFLTGAAALDEPYRRRVEATAAAGKTLRYVATLSITLREADMSAEDRRNRHLRRLIGIELILSPAGHVLAVRKERMKSPLPRPQPRRRALTPVPVL